VVVGSAPENVSCDPLDAVVAEVVFLLQFAIDGSLSGFLANALVSVCGLFQSRVWDEVSRDPVDAFFAGVVFLLKFAVGGSLSSFLPDLCVSLDAVLFAVHVGFDG